MARVNFAKTGSAVSWTVPTGVTSITLTVKGAQGTTSGSETGGLGGEVIGTLAVTAGTTYWIFVGGQDGTNGGGSGNGGGMTWFSTFSTFAGGAPLVVAGGGGAGGSGSPYSGNGGAGGGSTGGSGTSGGVGQGGPGGGGTQLAGGAAGSTAGAGGQPAATAGSSGQGGTGGGAGGGGGGGGYFGGGGGGATNQSGGGGNAGGGSSFVDASLTSVTNTQGVITGDGTLGIDYTETWTGLASVSTSRSASRAITVVGHRGYIVSASASVSRAASRAITSSAVKVAGVFSELAGQVGVSGYKYTDATLYAKQNATTVRPAVQCFVKDETFLVNQQIYNNSSLSGTWNPRAGDSCIAPDGSILAIGTDPSGNLVFGKISNGNTPSQWGNVFASGSPTSIIVTRSTDADFAYFNANFGAYTGFHLNASIAVSDYIGSASGGYIIDVYYWYNENNLGTHYYDVKRARSTDGGLTWTIIALPELSIPIATKGFFQVAAGKPVYNPSAGTTSGTCFVLVGTTGGIVQNNTIKYFYSPNGTFSPGSWHDWLNSTPQYGYSSDWILQGFDVQYINGIYYVVFSGYHNYLASTNTASIPAVTSTSTVSQFFGNFGLYMMRVLNITDMGNSNPPYPIFDEPREILTFNSSANTNLNQCLYPGLNYDGSYLWLVFRGDFTTSVSETNTTSTTTNYYISKSLDYKNFDYPVTVIDGSGFTVANPNGLGTINNGLCKYSLSGNQNGYYYFFGDSALWQYVQNEVIADVSGDVIGFSVQDQSGGTSSINLTIANGSGKWAGPNPSGVNYQAIWKNGLPNRNSKIYLQLGYYTSSNTFETIPRNIFYIDDITQNTTPTKNDLVLSGRDFNKLMTVTQTAVTFNFQGPDFYFDGFTNATIPNWNQSMGTFIQSTQTFVNPMSATVPFTVFAPYSTYAQVTTGFGANSYNTNLSGRTLATLSGFSIIRPQITLSTSVYIPLGMASGAEIDIYPFYVDDNNYICITLTSNGSNVMTANIVNCINGQQGNPGTAWSSNNTFSIGGNDFWPVYIRLYNYGQFMDVMVGENGYGGNSVYSFQNASAFYQNPPNQNTNTPYTYINGKLPTIAIGTGLVSGASFGTDTGVSTPSIWTSFSSLKFTQSTYSQNIEELTKKLATKSHIFSYNSEKDYIQDLYDTTQWNSSGTYNLNNREINLSNQSFVLQNNLQYSDGQIDFDAQLLDPNFATTSTGFDFIFRNQSNNNLNNCYKLRIMNSNNNGGSGYVVKASLVISSNSFGATADDRPLFSSIIPDQLPVSFNTTYNGENNPGFDLTQWNHFSITFNKGWIYVFINDILMMAWYENNYLQTFSTGYWGFSTVYSGGENDNAFSSTETLYVKNIKFPTFFNQNPYFGLNPGDDLTSAITQNLQTMFGWYFSNLGGVFKIVTLKSTDLVSYNYGDNAQNYLLYANTTDSSDKEYYNSVLVVGDGVSYLATDNTSIGSNGILREEVIVDYTITTVSAAQSRATQELTNIQKYGAQPAPQTNINPGSEVFDVVNIVDKSTNSTTGLNGNYRVYTQTLTGDNMSQYSITLGTGQL